MTFLLSGGISLRSGSVHLVSGAAPEPPSPTPVTKPAILLSFDDGCVTGYTEGYAYMEPKGMKGTFFIHTAYLGGGGRISIPQLTEAQTAGWDVANHTINHPDLTTLSQAQVEAELTGAQATLEANGFTQASKHIAYPYGAYNATVLAAMAATGMETGRTVVAAMAELPPSNSYAIPAYNLDSGRSLAQAKDLVDSVISQNKVLCMYLHDLLVSPGVWDWSISDFRALIDYIDAQGVPTITVNEYYTGVYA